VIQWIRVGLAGLAFLGFSIGAALIAVLAMPWWWLLHVRQPRFRRAGACQWWIKAGCTLLHDYMRWCRLINFNPRLVDRTVPAGGFVIVANHPTLVDQCALSAVFGRIICVAKPLLFRVPFVGRILRACNYLKGGESEGLAGGVVVNQALDRIAQSMPLLVFPEGTRSPRGGLRPFRRGPFEIACRANVPVVPILIRCEPLVLGKGMPWYDISLRTAILTVTRLPVMNPAAFGGDAGSLTEACEATFRRHLGLEDPPKS
jgi:1-acyl-sn-glycerol-3-phosphate acyltransferase